ncbi:nicotinamidase-related amidase [Nocardioides ginsengisegetis]|uniref:Nicotinamidase-related amidase n=1 Tax=Nocardioides ginsengisegetis TaxID=661491 RepID=A0A7W3IZ60_9ACTN|nr:isochorismatase family protein [Nocardioides ginsengisegetis]MBA8803283.1 nicotinamidase-related amidase [Nocardioides ginsengisegetis]
MTATPFGNPMGPGSKFGIVVVDFQRGFTDPSATYGMDLDSEVGVAYALLERVRRAGLPVYFSVVAHAPDGSDVGLWGLKAPAIATYLKGGPEAAVDERLKPQTDELVLVKQVASACFGTGLLDSLIGDGVDSVLVVGTSTSGCVRATAVDLFQAGIRPFVVADAVGDRDTVAHANALRDLHAKYADVISSETAFAYLAGADEDAK